MLIKALSYLSYVDYLLMTVLAFIIIETQLKQLRQLQVTLILLLLEFFFIFTWLYHINGVKNALHPLPAINILGFFFSRDFFFEKVIIDSLLSKLGDCSCFFIFVISLLPRCKYVCCMKCCPKIGWGNVQSIQLC